MASAAPVATTTDDEKTSSKAQSTSLKDFVLDKDSITTNYDSTKLDKTMKLLLNHECKYEVAKDGSSATFYPSPHLYDKDGNFTAKPQLLASTEVNKLFTKVCSELNCDSIEGAFTDHLKESNKQNKKIQYVAGPRWGFTNNFIKTYEMAWDKHYPISFNANHIWLLILQAVALHVDKHAEQLRSQWVSHQGKKELVVYIDEFVKGSRDKNDWSTVVSSFSDQIDKNTIEGTVKLLESNFSNTSYIDNIANKITIMDICKNYFEYKCSTCCGFPQITLQGKKEDWVLLHNKAKELLLDSGKVEKQFGIKWSKALLPVLNRFIAVFDGEIDCLFWNSMIKRGAQYGSGGWSWYTGWINVFYPLIQGRDNRYCEEYSSSVDYVVNGKFEDANSIRGNDTEDYPNGLGSAPVKWEYYSLEFKLKFISGFFGIEQDKETGELAPMVGWLIGETTKENQQMMNDMKKLMDSGNLGNVNSKVKSAK